MNSPIRFVDGPIDVRTRHGQSLGIVVHGEGTVSPVSDGFDIHTGAEGDIDVRAIRRDVPTP
jgi:hypothetical protein